MPYPPEPHRAASTAPWNEELLCPRDISDGILLLGRSSKQKPVREKHPQWRQKSCSIPARLLYFSKQKKPDKKVFFPMMFGAHTHIKEQMEPGASYKTVVRQPQGAAVHGWQQTWSLVASSISAPVTLTSLWDWDAFPHLPQVQEPLSIPFPMFRKENLFFLDLFPICLLYISISQKAPLCLLVLVPEEFPWRDRVGGYRHTVTALGGALLCVRRFRSCLCLFKCLQLQFI